MRIDMPKLRSEINEVSGELKALKKEIRQPGHMLTWKEAATMKGRKAEATLLCCLRAHLHGKIHLSKFGSLENATRHQTHIFEEHIGRFRLAEEKVA